MTTLGSWARRHVPVASIAGVVAVALPAALLAAGWTGVSRTSNRTQGLAVAPAPSSSSPLVGTTSTVGRSPTTLSLSSPAPGRAATRTQISVLSAGEPNAAAPTADVPILSGLPVGVPPGDYLLTATGVTAPSWAIGRVEQKMLVTGTPQRTADFHAGPRPTTVTAEVRVGGPLDTFSLVSDSAPISSSRLTLTPALWSYVARGQEITSPSGSNVLLHGINGVVMAGPVQMASTFSSYPSVAVVRLAIDEGCWDPFFTAAQSSKLCNAYNPSGQNTAAAYRARMTGIIKSITSAGRAVILHVKNSGRDNPSYISPTITDVFAPDQHTLTVYDDLVAKFGNDPHVIFETFNEPKMKSQLTYAPNGESGAKLWRDGGMVTLDGMTWNAPGVQETVNRIRSAGASNLIMVEGPQWGEDLTPVMTDPVDGTNLVYSYHAYNPGNTTVAPELNTRVAPLFDPALKYRYAGFLSEFGTLLQDSQGSQFLSAAIQWAQAHHTGWAAWGWFPNGWDNYGLLTSYSPMSVNIKGQTVISAL